MKRKYVNIIIIVFLLLLILEIYYMSIGKGNSEKESIQKQLVEYSFANNTKLEKKIKEEVKVSVKEVNKDSITVIVEAPNISEDLIDWVSNSEDEITDEQIEEKILMLIQQSQKKISTYELFYGDTEEKDIQYTEEYLNGVSCGLNEFYSYAMNQVILEILEENRNE